MPATVGRSHGRQGVHAGSQGPAGDHLQKIVLTMIAATAVIVLVLVMTKIGRDIAAATQRFMLFYAGVFALIGLTGSVLAGLLATDRVVMTPGRRVMAQAVHRAMSFGALAFLIIHIVTEILAQRAHVIDAVIPFLSPYRTFYIGLGTIASDLIIAIVVTSILRRRFTGHGAAWRWRAIHYSAYAAFLFGVLHGLLGGREAKPYVDWSYGFAIALTALGLAVRFMAISLRPKESLSTPPGGERGRTVNSSPLHAAAMSPAQSQLGGNPVQVLPPALAAQGQQDTGAWVGLPPAQAWSVASGPQPALAFPPSAEPLAYATQAVPGAYHDFGSMPLGAPYADDASAGLRARPYIPVDPPVPALPAAVAPTRQPMYEPGYDGPPRFEGAPRGDGIVPQDDLSSYPYGPVGTRPQASALPPASAPVGYEGPTVPRRAIAGQANPATGPMPRPGSGPMPQLGTGHVPHAGGSPQPRPATGPVPRVDSSGPMPRFDLGPACPGSQRGPDAGWFSHTDSGPIPRAGSGPHPRMGPAPMPQADSGPYPRMGTGPMPRADSGPYPRMGSGPMPRADSGPYPRMGSGPMPRADSGPYPRAGSGPMPQADSGPYPRLDSGPMPRVDSGPYPQVGSGPMPQLGSGSHRQLNSGPMPRMDSGPYPRPESGSWPRADTGSFPRIDHGPMPGTGTGAFPRADYGPMFRPEPGLVPQSGTGPWPRPHANQVPRPDTGPVPRIDSDAPRPERGPDPLSDPDPFPQSTGRPLPCHGRGPAPRSGAAPAGRPDTGQFPRTGSRPHTGPLPRAARHANPDDPRYREAPGRNGGNEWH